MKAPFDGRPLRLRDAVITPSVMDGGYVFRITQTGRPEIELRVHAVVGGGYMTGGGTQAFFGTFPDGTLRFLPFDYSVTGREWFCATAGRADRGLVPISPAIRLADCQDWPPTRVLGSMEGFQACQQCHGSQITAALDSVTKRFDTRFTSLTINCESCHGPGRRHVELAHSGNMDRSDDIGMRPLATLTKDQSLQICFQCHAVKSTLDGTYLPGMRFETHFALKLPQVLSPLYLPDGRTATFAYQEGHLASDCYLNGSMTCTDCHDPHSQRYRDVVGTPLVGRFDDGQCLDCHPSKAERPQEHTFHRPESPGSRCTACHMPYRQEANAGERIRYARSDHTVSIPRPHSDSNLGIESACQQCHRDRSVDQLQVRVTAWYGAGKPEPRPVSALISARDTRDAATAFRTVLSAADDRHPMAEAAGLTHLLVRYAKPDTGLDAEVRALLERRAGSADPDQQALALAILHLTEGDDPGVRRFLVRKLRDLGPRDEVVRRRWAWILSVRGEAYVGAGDYLSAVAAYRKWQELEPEDPEASRALGLAYSRLGDYATGIEQLRRGLTLQPGDPQALLELGFAFMRQGELDSAEAAYREAIAANPWSAGGYANLASLYLLRGAFQPAVEALERAAELRPGLAAVHFQLARAYAALGEIQAAIAAAERGLEFDPRNVAARAMLEELRRQGAPSRR